MKISHAAGLADVRDALAEGAGRVILASHHGPAAIAALIRLVCEDFPDADSKIFLDCADEPGMVMKALRNDVQCLLFDGPAETLEKLQNLACQTGATVLPRQDL